MTVAMMTTAAAMMMAVETTAIDGEADDHGGVVGARLILPGIRICRQACSIRPGLRENRGARPGCGSPHVSAV